MIEIERKFLLNALPTHLEPARLSLVIRQGYISSEDPEVRVNIQDNGAGPTYWISMKAGEGLARTELEAEVTREQWLKLIEMCPGTVQKTRHYYRWYDSYLMDKLLLEVDEYRGKHAGRIVVEVEFASVEASQKFQVPPWFGQEVTLDPSFKNKNLATSGVWRHVHKS